MMFQIECLINEYSKTPNENITNFIDDEYIKWSYLFNKKFMQILCYIFMITKFGLFNVSLLLTIIDFVTRHAQNYFYLFIHSMYTIL
jgi:hypothetical protein